MKTAYIDCFSGISGDMFIGALLDAGLPFEDLQKAIGTLPFDGYSIKSEKVMKNGLCATGFLVHTHEHHHVHRNLTDIEKIINEGCLKDNVKQTSLRIFRAIAEAEGEIHNHPPEKVHFHEVGAIDSIIDIVGAAFGMDYLGIGAVSASRIPLGSGFIESGHGRIPVPAPATISLLKGIPVYDSGVTTEIVTPTGAAIIREYAASFGAMVPMTVESIGYGAGTRDLDDRPNMLRILIGSENSDSQTETIVLLHANIDDSNPEWLGYLMESLFRAGALDVTFFPVQMKKNRPGIQLEVIASPALKESLTNIIFKESSTLGVRYEFSRRAILKRSETVIKSHWGDIKAKKITRLDGIDYIQPEYESCRKIAEKSGLPLRDIYSMILSENSPK